MNDAPYTLKSFKKQRRRPLKALHHFRELIKNKEDTTQVFYVIEALNGDNFQRQFVKFANSEQGQARLENNRYLPTYWMTMTSCAGYPRVVWAEPILNL